MAYPGNQELSAQAQERVIAAFRQVINKLQAGQRDEARIGLEFVLRLDPGFTPAANLHEQLANSSGPIDVGAIIGGLQAPTTDAINLLLVEAVEDFNNRDFLDAQEKVKKVLLELPGHKEARELLNQVEEALRVETQVGQFLTQAREALDRGDPQEAANFVMMAQALDPHCAGIDGMLREIQEYQGPSAPHAPAPPPAAAPPAPEAPPTPPAPVEQAPAEAVFDTMAFSTEGFEPSFEEEAPAPPAEEAQDFFVPEPLPASDETPEFAADEPPEFAPLEAPQFAFDEAEEPAAEATAAEIPAADDEEFAFGEAEVAPPPAAADDDLFGTDSDVADLFDAAAADESLFGASDDPLAGGGGVDVQAALDAGAVAFDEGNFKAAIDEWSRIFEVDPQHEEATRRITMARQRMEESEAKVRSMLQDAESALADGDGVRATELVNAALVVFPDHEEALALQQRMETGATGAPPPVPPGLGTDTADDLFSADVEELDTPLAASPTDEALDLAIPERGAAKEAPAAAPKRSVPWKFVGVGAASLLVILVGVWLGSRFLASSGPEVQTEALSRILEQAEELYQQRRVDEAIHLLEEYDASELDRERIKRRIAKYRTAAAPPEPTAIPEALLEGERLLNEQQWMAAFQAVERGLEAHAQDEGLLELKQRIMDFEPRISTLHTAMVKGDFRTAASLAEELTARHANDPGFQNALERSLFNAGLTELRAFNLTGAEVYLAKLARLRPNDAEVLRILKFIGRYKARPVDMQLEIFIKSLNPR